MANNLKFLQQKWAMWFHTLDLQNTGFITMRNAELCTQYFVDANDFNPKRVDEVSVIFDAFWNAYIFKYHEIGPNDSIDLHQFVNRLSNHYTENSKEFISFFRRAFTLVHIATDVNTDGYMDYQELAAVFKSFKHDDDTFTKKMFSKYGPNEKGLIPIGKVIDAWVDLVTGDDPTMFNAVIEAFKSDNPDENAY